MEVTFKGIPGDIACSSHTVLYPGIEEDFVAWKDGFIREVFPALCGERPLGEVARVAGEPAFPESCVCGKKSKQECCKVPGEAATTATTVSQDEVSW